MCVCVLQSTGSQRVGHGLATEQQQDCPTLNSTSWCPKLRNCPQFRPQLISHPREQGWTSGSHCVLPFSLGSQCGKAYCSVPKNKVVLLVQPYSCLGFSCGSVAKTREMWVQSLGQEDPLEEEMATHSNIPAWDIPHTEEPGGLQSMGSQRLRHDWAPIHIIVVCGVMVNLVPVTPIWWEKEVSLYVYLKCIK